jgi:Integrase core domain
VESGIRVQVPPPGTPDRRRADRNDAPGRQVGDPEENGYASRLMRTIREEGVDLSESRDFADAYGQLGRFLDDVYDRKRLHSSLS